MKDDSSVIHNVSGSHRFWLRYFVWVRSLIFSIWNLGLSTNLLKYQFFLFCSWKGNKPPKKTNIHSSKCTTRRNVYQHGLAFWFPQEYIFQPCSLKSPYKCFAAITVKVLRSIIHFSLFFLFLIVERNACSSLGCFSKIISVCLWNDNHLVCHKEFSAIKSKRKKSAKSFHSIIIFFPDNWNFACFLLISFLSIPKH